MATITEDRLNNLNDHWNAANYLAAAMLYLKENPLLINELTPDQIKPRLMGHWGTVPALNLIYSHLNRLIQDSDAEILYIPGSGHGAPAIDANQYIEGSLGEHLPEYSQSNYNNYGPGVVGDWGVGTLMPKNSIPKDGVYLIQTFSSWPKGHSWIVLDYDESTGKILTLESNTGGSGLNGVGFADLGPIRSTNAHNWKQRVNTTWSKRVGGASQVYMARLDIDHKSVLDWISSQ